MDYHKPVLLNECIKGLCIKPQGTYVDVTFGGGGHSKLILKSLNRGRLLAFDQDFSANINSINAPSFKLINANFRYLKNFLKMEKIFSIDGLLADLGVSSYQLNVPNRGFSTRFKADLDMRMNIKTNLSAKHVVNDYLEKDLADIFYKYGEIRNSRQVANRIVISRNLSKINTTSELVEVISDLVPEKYRNQFLAKVFQAIRIEVNDEISALGELLLSAEELLNPGGRLVVVSYHSLEDRLVKNLMKKGSLSGDVVKDFYGNTTKKFKEIQLYLRI